MNTKNLIFFSATISASFLSGCASWNNPPSPAQLATEPAPIACEYPSISGVYPHLSFWNKEDECGTGALVNWADKLWAITYGPHCVFESSDKLYEIDSKTLDLNIRKESVGGTHANRFIHDETEQLFIGCYAIDKNGNVRVISRKAMPGRLTGNATSITDPKGSIYFATMEEGLYEVDARSLKVNELIRDGNLAEHPQKLDAKGKPIKLAKKSNLHGYHGKGLYSGFGKVFYANNGVRHPDVAKDPTLKSGALAEWNPNDADWTPVKICQFTEITGKNGIHGSKKPNSTPIWAIGWDAKSVILMLNDGGEWTSMRLPKASHSYDGSHGWNTEWPRIRDIGKRNYLMTMHGAFWNFPPKFSKFDTSGIRMRSSYLKVVGDFCRFNGVIALGCDDSARKEFLNQRALKGEKVSPINSNSNIWFVKDSKLDELGPKLARGSVFLRESVKADYPSEPMLTAGFQNRVLVLDHESNMPVKVEIQTSNGKDGFVKYHTFTINPDSAKFIELPDAEWTRIMPRSDIKNFTAHFNLSCPDTRSTTPSAIFDGIAKIGDKNINTALLRSLDADSKLLGALAKCAGKDGIETLGTYSLGEAIKLKKNPAIDVKLLQETDAKPKGIYYKGDTVIVEEDNERYLLPLNESYDGESNFGQPRVAREVATERDLLNCGGTFYELPAVNAQGFAKVRPIASHNLNVFDFCSYRGLMIFSGISNNAKDVKNPHIITSDDGKFSIWAGVIDDLWKLGKPVGKGSPWLNAKVRAGEVSDKLLLTGYDKKTLRVASTADTTIDIEVDIDGTGLWVKYGSVSVKANQDFKKEFPADFCGYWVRLRALDAVGKLTTTFIYE